MATKRKPAAVISGGARGIGFAIAERLAMKDTDLILIDAPPTPGPNADRLATADTLSEAADRLRSHGVDVQALALDVRDRARVRKAMEESFDRVETIGTLVHAAGVGRACAVDDLSDNEWAEALDTNLHGFYNLARVLTPHMTQKGGGHVMAVVGEEGRRGVGQLSHLAATSWATIGFAKSLALEVADGGVVVNVLCASPVATDFTRDGGYSSALLGLDVPRSSEDVAHDMRVRHPSSQEWVAMDDVMRAADYLLAATVSSTGAVLDVTAGMSALNTA